MGSENKTNLLYVITKLELGGAQKQLLALARGLDRGKFNIFLFTGTEGPLVKEAQDIPYLQIQRCRFLVRPIRPFHDLLAFFCLLSFIKKNNIKIVHTHSSKAGILGRLAARAAGVKLIVHTVHGWSFHDYQLPFLKRLYVFLERFTAGFTSRLIVVSAHDQAKGLRNAIGDAAKYRLIYYGINQAEFGIDPGGIRQELGLKSDEPAVGMVACFKPQKCPQDFISAAALISRAIPKARFILVGDGILRRDIERQICSCGLKERVILTGWRSDIPRVMAAFDVFMLTSLWEGMPIAVLEAMAASKAVVATDTGGLKEVLEEGRTGFLTRPHDVEDLSRKAVRLLTDKELRVNTGNLAKERLKQAFRTEDMLRDTGSLYADCQASASVI